MRTLEENVIPVSSGQYRLWLLDRFERTGWTYNIVVRAGLTGELDLAAVEMAVVDVLARHEALRTSFPEVDGVPVQNIWPTESVPGPLRVVDVPAGDLSALEENGRYVFDLTSEVPFKAVLFRFTEDEFLLQMVCHHIVIDGWSVRPLMRDLGHAYAARRDGRAPEWEPLPVQFADFALWQREVLGSADDPDSLLTEQLDFWRTALTGMPAEVAMPADRERPRTTTYRGGAVPFTTGARLHREIRRIASESAATPFMVFHAVLAALFSRLGAGDDIPLGTVTAGRSDESLNDLVGFFVNTLPLRTDVSGDPSFGELITRVRDFDLRAFDHQDAPFEEVVQAMAPRRRSGRHPLFQTMLAIQSHAPAVPDFPGVSVEMQKAETIELHSAKFDLYFDLAETWTASGEPAGIAGHLVHAADLWDERSVLALAERVNIMAEALAADPDTRVSQPDILLPRERALLTAESDEAAPPSTCDHVPAGERGRTCAAGRSPGTGG
ncbi:condensation domain-containing protein [Streptomyces anulatus]